MWSGAVLAKGRGLLSEPRNGENWAGTDRVKFKARDL